MRDHQKYFALEGADGKLAPHFLAVLNTQVDAEGEAIIRHGNARVLRARFKDARFFWTSTRDAAHGACGESQVCHFPEGVRKLSLKTEANLGLAREYGNWYEIHAKIPVIRICAPLWRLRLSWPRPT